jgi:hypothetical protein
MSKKAVGQAHWRLALFRLETTSCATIENTALKIDMARALRGTDSGATDRRRTGSGVESDEDKACYVSSSPAVAWLSLPGLSHAPCSADQRGGLVTG